MINYNQEDHKCREIATAVNEQLRGIIFENSVLESVYLFGINVAKPADITVSRYFGTKPREAIFFLRSKGYRVFEHAVNRAPLCIGLGFELRENKFNEALKVVKFLIYTANGLIKFKKTYDKPAENIRLGDFIREHRDVVIAEALESIPNSTDMTRIYEFASNTRPDTRYRTMLHPDGHLTCNCPGWTYNRSGNRTCRHTNRIQEILAGEGQALGSRVAIEAGARRAEAVVDFTLLRDVLEGSVVQMGNPHSGTVAGIALENGVQGQTIRVLTQGVAGTNHNIDQNGISFGSGDYVVPDPAVTEELRRRMRDGIISIDPAVNSEEERLRAERLGRSLENRPGIVPITPRRRRRRRRRRPTEGQPGGNDTTDHRGTIGGH